MIPVQVLDGIGAGMLSVAVPGLVARILDGTGHINVGQGAVMAAQAGRRLSPVLGGAVAQHLGFRAAFLLLAGLSLGALIIWVTFAPMLRRAARLPAAPSDRAGAPPTATADNQAK